MDGLPPRAPAGLALSHVPNLSGPKLSGVETTKRESRGLRGTLAEELGAPDARGGISEAAYNLLKFHGSYEQYDRDTATERKQAGQDKEWQFMLRVRCPGGRMTGEQYLALDRVAEEHANGTLRITTRQGIQFHGVLREHLKPAIADINRALLTTRSACGDVARNVMTTPAPRADAIHRRLADDARMLSGRLLPQTRAYDEIFLDVEAGPESGTEGEPVYGPTYLPRKFKVALAHAGDNTVDLLTNDLGLLAVWDGEVLQGYQAYVGGGLGMTHNKPRTYPRLASPLAFVGPDRLWDVTRAVVEFTRDHGDRSDRKRARLKYVVDDLGLDTVRERVAEYYGEPLPPPLPTPAFQVPELLGWHEQGDGRLWLGVPVPSGRIQDGIRAALREVVQRFGADPVFTPQQDVLLSNLSPADRDAVEAVLRGHGVTLADELSPLARWSLACPALPTCGLALTEAERVQPAMVAQVEAALARHGLAGERLSLRITGCPNGCARSYAGDIGLVGRIPGQFALFVGGDFEGTRLSQKLHERVAEAAIGDALDPLFEGWAASRAGGRPHEGFGDFCDRVGIAALLQLGRKQAA